MKWIAIIRRMESKMSWHLRSIASVALGLAWGFLTPLPVSGSSPEDVLDFTAQAHRATRLAIRTLSCRIEGLTINFNPSDQTSHSQKVQGLFQQDGEDIRLRATIDESSTDCLFSGSKLQAVTRGKLSDGTPTLGAGIFSARTFVHQFADVRSRSLQLQNCPDTAQHLPFEELLSRCEKASIVKPPAEDPSRIVARLIFPQSQFTSASWQLDVTFQPQYNYLVTELRYQTRLQSGKNLIRHLQVTKMHEAAPGIFFPSHIQALSTLDGQEWTKASTTLTEIRVNQPIPRSAFQLVFPHNIKVADNIRGEVYHVDAAGRQISRAVPLLNVSAPGIAPSDPANSAPRNRTRSTEESPAQNRWLMRISCGVLLLAGLLALRRRLQRSSLAPS